MPQDVEEWHSRQIDYEDVVGHFQIAYHHRDLDEISRYLAKNACCERLEVAVDHRALEQLPSKGEALIPQGLVAEEEDVVSVEGYFRSENHPEKAEYHIVGFPWVMPELEEVLQSNKSFPSKLLQHIGFCTLIRPIRQIHLL